MILIILNNFESIIWIQLFTFYGSDVWNKFKQMAGKKKATKGKKKKGKKKGKGKSATLGHDLIFDQPEDLTPAP